jgi:class 3 adenylate cyclase/tetratricopeptide (TPR) repeat protein
VVSVLFVDLVGFTAHTAQSDPEDVRARLTVYHREIREDVERFGGRVEKLMGDGVFAVFGAPIAHEDDPERAVRAALRMQRSVDDLNAADPELSLSIRIAVTTGEAIVQIEGDDPDREGIIGDVVNTASRLEAVAPPGGIVVDERTCLATRDAVVYADLDPVSVKGKVEPLRIWQPLEARSRYGVDVDRSHTTPFVGRDAELGVLVDAFERTVNEGTVQLVTIIGEPGVGKSRLLNEFRESIDARPDLVWWRQGRCLPYGDGITFWALSEIVKAHAGILDSDTEMQAQAKLRAAVRPLFSDAPTAEWVRARLEAVAGVGGTPDGIEQAELFSAWSRFFEALATRNPLVIVVEDLHWADEAMLDFLEHITDWAVSSPILVVTTARPELFSLRGSWGGGKRNAATVSLTPLNAEQAAVLLGALLETTVLDAAVQQAILDRSEGNPLYVTEFVRLADDKGMLRNAAAIADLALPSSVQAIAAARLDLLPAEEKAALQAAAVVGKTFWAGAVRSLRPTLSTSELVRNLTRRELIRPVRGSSMHAQEEYAFSHSVIRDVCYGQIPREDRARLHEATAAWIDTVTGPQGTDNAELLAYHLGESVSLSSAADPELELRAYQIHMQAGERARGLSPVRAAGYYRIAVEHAGSGTDRAHALLELSDTLRLNEPDRIRPLLDEALALFREASDVEGEATALSMLAGFLWWRGETSEAYARGPEAFELVKDLPTSAAKARVMMTRASGFYLRGDAAAALEVIDQAADVVAEAGTAANQVGFLYTRGGALVELGDPSGLDDLQAAVELALDRNMTHAAVTALNNLATVVATARSTDEGLAAIDRGIDLCEERGAVAGTIWATFTKCEILVPAGRWDEVMELADDVIARDAEIGGSQAGTGAAGMKAVVLFYRGREAEARALHDSVLDAAREIGDRQVLAPTLSFAATLAADAGDEASVLSLGREYGSVTTDNPGMRSYHLADLTAALAFFRAAELLEGLVRSARPVGALGEVQVARARGHAAAVAEDWPEAADHLGRAIEAAGPAGRVLDGTLARIERARALAAAGAIREIPQLLDEARAQAEAMGATKILGRIEALEDTAAAAEG